MAMVFTNAGEQTVLEWIFKSAGEDVKLKLYQNDVTPDADTVAGDLTEADFTGYSVKTLARASWNDATTNAQGKAEITYADQDWTATSAQTIYGYFVTDQADNLLFAEKFAQSRSLQDGDSLTLSVVVTLASEA